MTEHSAAAPKTYNTPLAFRLGSGLVILAALVLACGYLGLYLAASEHPHPTLLADLEGSWSAALPDESVTLDIKTGGRCALLIIPKTGMREYYSGKCVIGRDKAPVTFTIYNLPAYDFNLYTIIDRVNDHTLLVAPFAKVKRARPITFEDALILEKVHHSPLTGEPKQ